jgi:electron transfer flavoprotein alpha subunit
VYGGNALATVTFSSADPQVVVLRGKTYEPLAPDATRKGDVVRVDISLEPSVVRVRHVETVRQEAADQRLEDARVVIAGGRGLGGPEPFEKLEELARLLGGAVGASRAVCDAGWLDHSYQVGLTGKTVTPDLYITVGVSGASQHMAGCSGAKNIVAINRDADANIFKEASYGVVGDWSKVLPAFIEAVGELVD